MKIDDPQILAEVSQVLKAMADPTRLRMLQELIDGERSVGELVARVGTTQANVSKHLAVLRRAHIVAFTREGASVRYRIGADYIPDVCAALCRGLSDRFTRQDRVRRSLDRMLRKARNNQPERRSS